MNKIYQKPFPGEKNAFKGLFGVLRIKSHSRGVLSGIFRRDSGCLFGINRNTNEDPRQKPSGMTTSFHKGPARTGFTLIELLVVVLIIGILSSIALPQYTKAVEKARMAEAKIVLKNILDSVERYHLESDDMPNIATDLDITPPGDCDASGDGGAGACMTKNFYYHGVGYECPPDVNVGSCAMLCATRNGTHTDICLCGPNCAIDPPGRFFCLSGNINDEDSACKSLGAVKESHSYFFN